jgi:molecular chaperone DnaK (HSP70)
MDLFKKTMEPVEKCLTDGGMKKTEINEVVLSVVLHVFQRFNNSLKASSTEKT